MAKINENYLKLPGNYLFSEVSRRIAAQAAVCPDEKIIRLSIGDVTRPLPPAVVEEMGRAVAEMGTPEGFHGYGPEQGYPFLREAIAREDYARRGVELDPDEIFISDGSKSDCAGIGEIFGQDDIAAVCDPVYPVYADVNGIAGRAGEFRQGRWSRLVYLPCIKENNFIPIPPQERVDMIYLCLPNNPTGAMADCGQLRAWVEYANDCGAVILYDGAYEAFIQSEGAPRTIYQISGARTCAIELRSFSKTAGFTGVRCGYTVIPRELVRRGKSLHALWSRRQATKCNGVCYVVQRGAAAVYSAEGRRQVRENIDYYRKNADLMRKELAQAGMACSGGIDAPYIWVKTPEGVGSWAFFDQLLERAHVAVTPGVGFGPSGEGYIRLTAFGRREETKEALERIKAVL